jgi:hypothetical protein
VVSCNFEDQNEGVAVAMAAGKWCHRPGVLMRKWVIEGAVRREDAAL